jgi:4-oxalocrotonate tautomerase
MPHVIVKLAVGRTEPEKMRLAEEVANAVQNVTGATDESVSVVVEDVALEDWSEQVYGPDIKAKWDTVYRKPGYDPL